MEKGLKHRRVLNRKDDRTLQRKRVRDERPS